MRNFILALVLSVLLHSNAVRAQNQFGQAELLGIGNSSGLESNITNFQLGDIDGDGDIDVLSELLRSDTLLVFYENDGLGNFTVKNIDTNIEENRIADLHVADLDDDGDLDILYTGYQYGNYIFSYGDGMNFQLNDGFGNFSQPIVLGSGASFFEVEIFDINNDGLLDVLAANRDGISYFLNSGGGVFDDSVLVFETSDFGLGGPILQDPIVSGDLNGDGFLDFLTFSNGGRPVDLFFYDSVEANFYQAPLNTGSLESFVSINLADMDNDGDLDILLSADEATPVFSYRVYYFENDGAGQFGAAVPLPIFGFDFLAFSTLDYNGDGLPDILAGVLDFYIADGRVGLFLNSGETDNYIEAEQVVVENTGVFSKMVLADLDGDGDSDLVLESYYAGEIFWSENMPGAPRAEFEYSDCPASIQNTSLAFFPTSTVSWDFGNGLVSNEIHPAFPFSEDGFYDLSLTICNDAGCDTHIQNIEFSHAPNFNIPSTGAVNEELIFTDNTNDISNWTWLFGDDSVSTEQTAMHSYSEPGVYLVELFLTDSEIFGCTRSVSQEIVIGGATGLEGRVSKSLEIFPKPCTDFFLIETKAVDDWKYEFLDVSGLVLDRGSFSGSSFQFDTSSLLSGLYLLKVQNSSGKAFTEKILVAKD